MPKNQTGLAEASATAVEPVPRLPNFGAAASIGPPSRSYRTHTAWGAISAAAVAPSQWDDDTDSDADAGDTSADDDADGGDGDGDGDEGGDEDAAVDETSSES